jgi:cold shock CspA family protein
LKTPSYGEATGTVASFEKDRGLGEIVATDGGIYPFHCTAIADGTRDIKVGKEVTFTVTAGHLGRLEATAIKPS